MELVLLSQGRSFMDGTRSIALETVLALAAASRRADGTADKEGAEGAARGAGEGDAGAPPADQEARGNQIVAGGMAYLGALCFQPEARRIIDFAFAQNTILEGESTDLEHDD